MFSATQDNAESNKSKKGVVVYRISCLLCNTKPQNSVGESNKLVMRHERGKDHIARLWSTWLTHVNGIFICFAERLLPSVMSSNIGRTIFS